MKDIWIDCDPGHDDALAILTSIAYSEQINILGISTIGGNQTLEKVTRNAQNILSFVNAHILLVKGQEGPLVRQLEPAEEAHGSTGMDGPTFAENDYPVDDANAIHKMYQTIMENKRQITLVALGPLTNIALLLKTYPEVHSQINCISMMGGGLDHGNVTALAEFNIYIDPEAAHIVFNAGIPIVMAGLDVTEKAEISISEINELKNRGRVSHLAYELLHFYNQSGKKFGFINSPIHDLCAVLYLLFPEFFTGEKYFVSIDISQGESRGLTYADKRRICLEPPNALVLTNVDRESFVRVFSEGLTRLDMLWEENEYR